MASSLFPRKSAPSWERQCIGSKTQTWGEVGQFQGKKENWNWFQPCEDLTRGGVKIHLYWDYLERGE
jgi:hypothetical protein